MGKLVIHMTKSREIIKSSSGLLSWTNSTTDLETYNPTSGYINVQALNFGFDTGTEVSSSPNLTLNRPRTTAGNKKAIPMSLKCSYLKEGDNPVGLVDSLVYLTKASNSGYIGLMYWLPNSDAEIVSGQAQDYSSSIFRVLHTNEWNGVKIPYANSGYLGTSIDPYVLPVIISDAKCDQTAGKNEYTITISLQLLVQEE